MAKNDLTVNGVPIEGTGAHRIVTLPSGAVAKIRPGKGRDLMRAHRAAGNSPEPMAIIFALVAELVEIDGQPLKLEEVEEMPLQDVLALQSEIVGENMSLPQQPASRPSSDSASQPASSLK